MLRPKHERDHLWDLRKGLDSLMLRPSPLAIYRRAGRVNPPINSPTVSWKFTATNEARLRGLREERDSQNLRGCPRCAAMQ
jgi:hypothetical protein